jgi:S1-C subfamily serine protease
MRFTLTGPSGAKAVELTSGEITIGREVDCDLVLDDEKVSRHHVKLTVAADGTVELADLGSTNGTIVNGSRVTAAVVLRGGEEVRLGAHVLRATPPSGVPSPGTVFDPAAAAAAAQGAAAGASTGEGSGPQSPPLPPGTAAVPRSPIVPPLPASPPPGFGGAPPPLGPAAPPLPGSPPYPVAAPARKSRKGLLLGVGALAAVAALVIGLVIAGPLRPGGGELSTAEIVDKARPSTLLISTELFGEEFGTGTGWVLDADEGLIVTNYHVVNGGTEFYVGAGRDRQEAALVGAAPCEDLAVLAVEDTAGLVELVFASQDALREGDEVVAVGYPGNASRNPTLQPTTGVISAARTSFDEDALDVPKYRNVIQTDAAINPGNSGGPLLDREGRLVGVNSASITLSGGRIVQNQGYAIGVDRVRDVVAELRNGDSIGWAGLGLEFPGAEEDFDIFGVAPVAGGVIAYSAVPRSPGDDSDLLSDGPVVITAINGRPLDGTLDSYCGIVGERQAGDEATFEFTIDDVDYFLIDIEFG